MRIRTLTQAVTEIRAKDPSSQIGYNSLTRLIKSGSLPYAKSGNRVLIDLDILEELFSGSEENGAMAKIGYSADPVVNK